MERSHQAILHSAARLLHEKGISGARVADVMKGAALTVGGFYAHFSSKDELVDEALRRTGAELRNRLFARLDEKPAPTASTPHSEQYTNSVPTVVHMDAVRVELYYHRPMPRRAAAQTIEAIINDAIAGVVARAVASIQKTIAAQIASELARAPRATGEGPTRRRRGARRGVRKQLTKWIADKHARRVPNFVIEATGLDTKKKIVAKFGPNVVFEKGKPVSASSQAKPAAPVKAKAPVVRKAAAAK